MSEEVFSAVALIERDGLFLAVSRKDDHRDLGFPGGKLEPGETAETAALRELREETSLRVGPQDISLTYSGVDDQGHLCKAFSVRRYDGKPASLEGAWVGWVPPRRLVHSSCSFKDYNRRVFDNLGLDITPSITLDWELVTFSEGLRQITGFDHFLPQHVTFLYGPMAQQFCPKVSVHQPHPTFNASVQELMEMEPVLGVHTHLQRSAVPLALFRYLHRRKLECAVVAVNRQPPPPDWESISSFVVECSGTSSRVKLQMVKSAIQQPALRRWTLVRGANARESGDQRPVEGADRPPRVR